MTLAIGKKVTVLLAAIAVMFTMLAVVQAAPAEADVNTRYYSSRNCYPKKVKAELRMKATQQSVVTVPVAYIREPHPSGPVTYTYNNYIVNTGYRTMVTIWENDGVTGALYAWGSTPVYGMPFAMYVRFTCTGTAAQ